MRSKSLLLTLGAAAAGLLIARRALRKQRTLELAGRTALITGGSRGLGLVLARQLGRRGAKLAICGRDAAAVERAAVELAGRGYPVLARAVDLADRAAAEDFVDAVAERYGRIDVVINCAGVIQVGPLDNATVDSFQSVMGANFWSALHVTLRALPHLREHGRDARIVNITSVGGRVAIPHLLSYGASKFALLGLSEGLRAELDAETGGPRVVTVIPGLMRTGSFQNADLTGQRERELTWFSLGASLPGLAMEVEAAAERIVEATLDGRAFVSLGPSAYAGDLLHRLSPRLAVGVMALTARMLPSAAEEPGADAPTKGRDVEMAIREFWPITLGSAAASNNNENN